MPESLSGDVSIVLHFGQSYLTECDPKRFRRTVYCMDERKCQTTSAEQEFYDSAPYSGKRSSNYAAAVRVARSPSNFPRELRLLMATVYSGSTGISMYPKDRCAPYNTSNRSATLQRVHLGGGSLSRDFSRVSGAHGACFRQNFSCGGVTPRRRKHLLLGGRCGFFLVPPDDFFCRLAGRLFDLRVLAFPCLA